MNRRLLFVLSLTLIVLLSACTTTLESSITRLQPEESRPLNVSNRPAITEMVLEVSNQNALTELQFQLAPYGIVIHPQPAQEPATSILKLEVADPNALRELQYVLAPFGVTIQPER